VCGAKTAMFDFDTPTHREESDAEKYAKRQKLFGTDEVYPMWVADMEFRTAPAIIEALQARVAHGVFGYSESDEELAHIAHSWCQKRYDIDIPASHFRSSPSIMTSMSAAIEALSVKGEGVTTMVPVYAPFMESVTSQHRTLYTVELSLIDGAYHIDWEALERALAQSKLFLLCNPHNPVGRVWRIEELARMAQLCETHEVTIISDDAHADIVRSSHRYLSMATVAPLRTVTLWGVGKGFNLSGLGATLYASHNSALVEAIDEVFHARHVVRGTMMGFLALKTAYTEGLAWLEAANSYIDTNIAYACHTIDTQCAPLKAIAPEGTYLVWIDCRGLGLSDAALKDFFVHDVGIGLSQGRFFGAGGRGFMRMNVAVPRAQLREVLTQLSNALKKN